MLAYAKENAARFLEAGQARFIQADASHFDLDVHFGLVVSTYDALNHLEDQTALVQCFRCVFKVLETGGCFIFDLNTRAGLRRWNGINVDDSNEEALVITRGVFDADGGRAWTRITGFVKATDGLYQRSDITAFNTAYQLEDVRNALKECGWKEIYFAQSQDLGTPITEPEKQARVFIVAHKQA
jgi:SAM-dependent methyltransferase